MSIQNLLHNNTSYLAPLSPDLLVEVNPQHGPIILEITPRVIFWTGLPSQKLKQKTLTAIATPLFSELSSLVEHLCVTRKPVRNQHIIFRDGRGRERVVVVQAYPSLKIDSAENLTIAFYIQEMTLQESQAASEKADDNFEGMLGHSPVIQKVFHKIAMYAPTDAPVLITGETGTGKELAARALHRLSRRRERRFLAVNCAALAEELLESELFGHERGSFTGAVRSHKGRFERAHQGTLFLDEIGEMPLRTQVKLLRVLEEGVLERVGGEHEVTVDVRIVAATNVPLEVAVQEGIFRADLYHRLAVLRVHMPALRERREDIPLLVTHFVHLLNQRYHRKIQKLEPEALAFLAEYPWPGNIRELRNVLERVYIETSGDIIRLQNFEEWFYERSQYFSDFTARDHPETTPAASYSQAPRETLPSLPLRPVFALPSHPVAIEAEPSSFAYLPTTAPQESPETFSTTAHSLPRTRQPVSRQQLAQAYLQAKGNIQRAAQLLGIHRATFYRWMDKLEMTREGLDTLAASQS